jgi:hypothetical protein
MGAVSRLCVWFEDYPWKLSPRLARDGKLDRLSFLHVNAEPFRIWWSADPLQWPLLVAWCGGPAAARLARRRPSEVKEAALDGLCAGLGISYHRLASRIRGIWSHNWEEDPFSRGAFSYVLAGGMHAGKQLSRPVQSTLFFAGEATDPEGSGTVEGALGTGYRAARQVHAALRHRSPRKSAAGGGR